MESKSESYLDDVRTEIHDDSNFGVTFLLVFVKFQNVRSIDFLSQIAVTPFEALRTDINEHPVGA